MFMSDDKKKRATLIISRLSGKPGSEEVSEAPKNENGDEVDSEIGHMSAAEDILDAIASKDAKALKNALKAFLDMCESEPESEDKE